MSQAIQYNSSVAMYSARKKMIPFWIIFDTASKPNKKNY